MGGGGGGVGKWGSTQVSYIRGGSLSSEIRILIFFSCQFRQKRYPFHIPSVESKILLKTIHAFLPQTSNRLLHKLIAEHVLKVADD